MLARKIEGRLEPAGAHSPVAVAGRSVRDLLHLGGEPEDDGSAPSLGGYRVELTFSREVEQPVVEQPALEETPDEEGSSQTVVITDRVSSVSDDDGSFVLTLGDGVDIKGETATLHRLGAVGAETGQDGRRGLEARRDRQSRGSALCSAFAGGAGRRGLELASVPGGRSSLRLPRHAAPGGTSGGHPGPPGGIERR